MGSVRFKLSVMMFLQYAIWGAWAVWLGGYMDKTLGFTGPQMGWMFSTTAIAAIISPIFMGIAADRFMATEKLIAALHLLGAALLLAAGFTTDFTVFFTIMLVYAALYMPTLALTNSISFANIENAEKDFPSIRVWGTLGWIAVGLLVGSVLDPEGGVSTSPMFLAAGCSAALGLFSFSLPHTPPKTKEQREVQKQDNQAGSSLLGDSAEERQVQKQDGRASVLSLLGDPSFLVFVLCSFLVCIPLSLYYVLANTFLVQLDAPSATSLQTIGQISEVFFLASMPFFIKWLGVKRMLLVGMAAWGIRYCAFATLSFPAVIFGLVLHGICYDFFFVASQVYVDNRTSEDQRASAQSFIAIVTMGFGMLVGSQVAGLTFAYFPPATVAVTSVDAEGKETNTKKALPAWDKKGETGIAKELSLKKDSKIDILALPEKFEDKAKDGSKTVYAKTDMSSFLSNKERDLDGDGKMTRLEWRTAKRNQWGQIWLWPAAGAFLTCLIFWVGFKDRASGSTEDEGVPKDELES